MINEEIYALTMKPHLNSLADAIYDVIITHDSMSEESDWTLVKKTLNNSINICIDEYIKEKEKANG